ncbi:hypothetical protein LINGRAHAP2_LOCUS32097 [Linum grandiflorum]
MLPPVRGCIESCWDGKEPGEEIFTVSVLEKQ